MNFSYKSTYYSLPSAFWHAPNIFLVKVKVILHFIFQYFFSSLFQGRIFYLTPSINPSWKKLKQVIEAAGGHVDQRRRKNVDQIREVNKPDKDPVYLIITCEHDLHIVADVLKAKIGIFNTEFVMSAVMKGKMDFDLTRSITTV